MLDYTVPPLQFLIGGFDASEYLDSISLSVPMYEVGQALLWSGQFKVSNNLEARINGLTDADFSERDTPSRWRPYQQVVRLNIEGYLSPAFRIENYRYNPETRTGDGILTQVPTAVAGDRPGVQIPTVVSGTIGLAIDNLLSAAFREATVQPGRAVAGDGGVLDVPLSTRNPWDDAVRLASLNWRWLGVDAAESIFSVNGAGGGLIFTRSSDRAEVVPDLAAIFQSAQKVIVTGARQVEDLTAATSAAVVPSTPRPKFKTTTEMRPIGTVFTSLGTDTTPIVFERKTIIYQYFDDEEWASYLPLFGNPLTAFLYDIQSVTQSGINIFARPPVDLNVPMQTITIKQQPIGYLFSAAGTEQTLTEAEVIVESNLRKLTLKPNGYLFPSAGVDTALVVEKREDLTSALIPPGVRLTPSSVDQNGQLQRYEARPALEAPQPIATRLLKTEVLRGEARLTPLNWTPVLDRPLVVDFGFLPDRGRADFLARSIAIREQQRRDQVLVDLPIPTEWLAAGWPLLARCQIGEDLYLMDGCTISIVDREAKFGFTGALIATAFGSIFTSNYQLAIDVESELICESIVTSAPGVDAISEIVVEMEVGSGIRLDAESELICESIVETSPGIMVYSELAIESDIRSEIATKISVESELVVETDIVIETPIRISVESELIVETIVTIGLLQTINFSVSPVSELEGTPIVQTINFSVSPVSELEGGSISVQTINFSVSPISQMEG